MRKVRALFISHSADCYGAVRSLLDILENIDRERFQPYLMCPRAGPLVDKAKSLGVEVLHIKRFRWTKMSVISPKFMYNMLGNCWSALRVAAAIVQRKVDVVYTNSAEVLAGALAAKLCGVKHIWHVREEVSKSTGPFKIIRALSNHVIANSCATRNRFPLRERERITVVYNGFRAVRFRSSIEAREELREKYGISDGEQAISLIGSINERKGQREMASAFPLILDRYPNAKLIFCGERFAKNGSYEQEVLGILKGHKVEAKVLFLGFREDVSEVYAITDVIVVPSRYEAFGRVIVEAMLCGIPVVATKVAGIPEIIDDQRSGILIPSREPRILANAVLSLFEDPGKMRRIGGEGRRSAQQRFSVEQMIHGIEGVLTGCVGQK